MITPVQIPKLSLAMEEGKLVRWLKKEGDRVEKDEILLELETDKALVELPSPAAGTLRKILVREGTVPVDQTIAYVGEPHEPLPEVSDGADSQPSLPSPALDSFQHQAAPIPAGGLRATPAARRRAHELGIDVSRLRGTGPQGRITQEDVEAAASPAATAVPAVARDLRPIIAKRMTDSWREVPHIHIAGQLRAQGLKSGLEKVKTVLGREITMTDLLLFVVASQLRNFLVLNTVWHAGRAETQQQVNLAFAVQTAQGVAAPVIPAADTRTLPELSSERRRLTQAALTGHLKLQEVEGGTFTLTNLGMYPVDFFAPIINYPQAAVLAAGRVRETAEFQNATVISIPRVWMNLAVDHRVADGALAAEFLQALENAFDALTEQI